MQGITRSLMQWCLFVLGIVSTVGAIVVFHYLGYYTERGPSVGEGLGIFASLAVGFAFLLVGVCNNKTIASIAEPFVFLFALATFLGNIASVLNATYFHGNRPSDGVIAFTVVIGVISLIATIVCAIGPGTEHAKPVEQTPANPADPANKEVSEEEISNTNYPGRQDASDAR